MEIFATGWNEYDHLGIKTTKNIDTLTRVELTLCNGEEINFIECTNGSTFFSTTANRIYACGMNYDGQLGIDSFKEYIYIPTKVHLTLSNDEEINFIECINGSTFISTTTKQIYSTGKNEGGKLGIKSEEEKISTPTRVYLMLSHHEEIKYIDGNFRSTVISTTASRDYVIGMKMLDDI